MARVRPACDPQHMAKVRDFADVIKLDTELILT